MAKEHPLLHDRRILQTAIEEQMRLSQEMTHFPGLGKAWSRAQCEAWAKSANAEAGRLVQRLVRVQEMIEERNLDPSN